MSDDEEVIFLGSSPILSTSRSQFHVRSSLAEFIPDDDDPETVIDDSSSSDDDFANLVNQDASVGPIADDDEHEDEEAQTQVLSYPAYRNEIVARVAAGPVVQPQDSSQLNQQLPTASQQQHHYPGASQQNLEASQQQQIATESHQPLTTREQQLYYAQLPLLSQQDILLNSENRFHLLGSNHLREQDLTGEPENPSFFVHNDSVEPRRSARNQARAQQGSTEQSVLIDSTEQSFSGVSTQPQSSGISTQPQSAGVSIETQAQAGSSTEPTARDESALVDSTDQNTSRNSTEQQAFRNSDRDSTEQSAARDSTERPAARGLTEQSAARGSMELSAARGSIELSAARGSMEQSATRGSIELSAARGSMEQSAAGGSMEQSAAGGLTEQSAARTSTEQSAARGSIELSAARGSMEQSAARGFTELSAGGSNSFELAAARGSTEMPAAGGSMEQSAAGGSTEQSAAVGSLEQSAAIDSTEHPAVIDLTGQTAFVNLTSSTEEVSPYFQQQSVQNPAISAIVRRDLNGSAADFETDDEAPPAQPPLADPKLPKKEKKGKGKKRKAIESVEEDNDEGSCCTICFEPWSNSGEHRVSSLRCGHFFGYGCIEKWLKGTGSSCPNCNEKSTKKEIRVHYISKLKAIDTSEKDRALADLEKERTTNRELNLRMAEYQVRNRLLQEEIEKLQREVYQYRKFRGDLPPALQSSQPSASALPANQTRLVYHRRYEMVRPGNDKTCRVLAYSSYMGMLLISQPSFTALAPGFGVRQFNVMDLKVGSFISLAKDQIRDMSFSQTSPHLLLSCGQDRTARITNMSSSQKVVEFQCDHQIWACDWAANNDRQIFLGTQKGTTLVYDIRHPTAEPTVLPFPDGDKKPIIGLRSVPAKPAAGFPTPGFLVMNLTSLWYWTQEVDNTWSYYKLNLEQKMLWSLDFDASSFLLLVGCKPCPMAMHLVLELNSTQVDNGRVFTASQLMSGRGGSFNQRSFLRSSLLPSPTGQGQVYLAFSKGSGQTDHKVIIQEVGSERTLQELRVDKPIIDIKPITINDDKYLALLGETDLIMYKWNAVK